MFTLFYIPEMKCINFYVLFSFHVLKLCTCWCFIYFSLHWKCRSPVGFTLSACPFLRHHFCLLSWKVFNIKVFIYYTKVVDHKRKTHTDQGHNRPPFCSFTRLSIWQLSFQYSPFIVCSKVVDDYRKIPIHFVIRIYQGHIIPSIHTCLVFNTQLSLFIER